MIRPLDDGFDISLLRVAGAGGASLSGRSRDPRRLALALRSVIRASTLGPRSSLTDRSGSTGSSQSQQRHAVAVADFVKDVPCWHRSVRPGKGDSGPRLLGAYRGSVLPDRVRAMTVVGPHLGHRVRNVRGTSQSVYPLFGSIPKSVRQLTCVTRYPAKAVRTTSVNFSTLEVGFEMSYVNLGVPQRFSRFASKRVEVALGLSLLSLGVEPCHLAKAAPLDGARAAVSAESNLDGPPA